MPTENMIPFEDHFFPSMSVLLDKPKSLISRRKGLPMMSVSVTPLEQPVSYSKFSMEHGQTSRDTVHRSWYTRPMGLRSTPVVCTSEHPP